MTGTAAPTTTAQEMTVQGILVPKAVVDPKTFFANVRRQRFSELSQTAMAGLGASDPFSLKQSGIVGAIDFQFSGNVVVTPGTGTVSSTPLWPYGLLRRFTLSANNMSNLINASGWMMRARELARVPGLTDRGVLRSVNGVQVQQGTLSLESESWGFGQNQTDIPSGTYDVEFSIRVPVAFDLELLGGALFAQTSATDLACEAFYELQSNLFTLTGDAAIDFSDLQVSSDAIVFNIPRGPNGEVVLPDLSVFHTFIQSSLPNLGNTENEVTLSGQGVGKQLLMVMFQLWNSGAPLVVNEENYGQLAWGYGGNTIPEQYASGQVLRHTNEEDYGSDFGAQGIGVFDWASHWAFRDSIDMGAATQIRLFVTPIPTLASGNNIITAQEIIVPGTAAGSVGQMAA
jgi:hypothetical protein